MSIDFDQLRRIPQATPDAGDMALVVRGNSLCLVPLTTLVSVGGGGSQEDSGGGAILAREVTLTNAQVLALPTTAIELVPAVVGSIIVPIAVSIRFDWVADYTHIGNQALITVLNGEESSFMGTLDEALDGKVSHLLAPGEPILSILALQQRLTADRTMGITSAVPDDIVSENLRLYALNTQDAEAYGNFEGGNAGNALVVTVYYALQEIS